MKSFRLHVLLLLALPLAAMAQTNTPSHRRIALTLAPNFSFESGGTYGERQTPPLGFHARLDAEYRLRPRLWMRAGVGWSQQHYKTDEGILFHWPGQFGNLPNLGDEFFINTRKDNMLQLPLALRYFFGEKQQVYADFEAGASIFFFEYRSDALRPTFGLSVGFQSAWRPDCWWFVQPALRVTSLYRGAADAWSVGLEGGVRVGI